MRKWREKKLRMDLIPHIIIVNSLRSINHPKVCQLVLAPDQGSQVVLDVILARGGVKSVIFVVPDDRAVEIITHLLHVVVVVVAALNSVAEFPTPSVLNKLLLHFITSSSQPFRTFQL